MAPGVYTYAAIVVVWVQTLVYVASLFGHLLTVVIVRCALLHGSVWWPCAAHASNETQACCSYSCRYLYLALLFLFWLRSGRCHVVFVSDLPRCPVCSSCLVIVHSPCHSFDTPCISVVWRFLGRPGNYLEEKVLPILAAILRVIVWEGNSGWVTIFGYFSGKSIY